MIGTNSYEIEQTEKYKLIEFIRKEENKAILKKHKFTKIKDDIEDDLGHKSRIEYKTFFALCYIFKLNVLFIHRKKCFQIHGGTSENIYHIIHKYDPPIENPRGKYKYVYDFDGTDEDREKYKNNELYFQWENVDKPLKCISYYKVKDLLNICILLKFKEEDYIKKTKPEIYDFIIENI